MTDVSFETAEAGKDWESRSANVTVLLMFADRTRWNLQVNQFSQALERRRKSGERILDLTASNPTTVGLKYDESAILRGLSRPGVADL